MRAVTGRLELRPWRPEEAELLFDIRSRPEVARWMSVQTPWADVDVARERIATWAAEMDDPLAVLAIVPTRVGHPVGSVSLGRVPGDDEVEIGWTLHPDHTGHGYAREAAAAMLARAEAAGVPRVWAIMWPDNDRSAHVARSIGMTDLGVVPDPWYGSPEEPDSLMFRWERARA